MRVVALAAFVVFTIFALTKLDDATSFIWVLVYGYAAMVSLMAAIGVRVTFPALAGAAAYSGLVWKLGTGPGFGLVACAVWSLFLAVGTSPYVQALLLRNRSVETQSL